MTENTRPTRTIVQVRFEGTREIRTFNDSFHIGSDSSAELVIDDPCVSPQHAVVSFVDGQWFIRDLEGSDGTFIDGGRVERCPLVGTKQIRFGPTGPLLEITVAESQETVQPAFSPAPRESQLLNRLLGDRAPDDMSRYTMMLRKVLRQDRSRLVRRFLVALAAVAAVAMIAITVIFAQRKQLARLHEAAADVFYAMKSIELEVSKLQLDTLAIQEHYRRQEELRQTYMEYLQELGVYGDDTPDDVQLIYRVIHRFGESEIDVSDEFVEEVRRYIERWHRSGRLSDAMELAKENGFAETIADIMLEYNMPPEFFYLAVQESGLKVEAVGPETRYGIAKGPWQLMPETARAYGIRIGPLVGVARFDPEDDRHDLDVSTRVAARHLRFIYTTDAQASGLLVMASYNWGHGNVVPLIQSMPENPRERNFWTLLAQHRDRIPAETYGYVLNIVSAAVVGENPSLFGFDFEPAVLRASVTEETEVEVVEASPP